MKFASKASLFVLPMLMLAVGAAAVAAEAAKKPLRAGMIGLDTSHVMAVHQGPQQPQGQGRPGRTSRSSPAFPAAAPTCPIAGTASRSTPRSFAAREIEIVPSIDELLKKVDVVLLESVDGRPHLEQARPVIAAGKPLFIDKPMAGSLADVIVIFDLAKKADVPCFSASSLRFAPEYQALRAGTSPLGKVAEVRRLRTAAHRAPPPRPVLVRHPRRRERSITIMGPGCKTVTRTRPGTVRSASGPTAARGAYRQEGVYGAEIEGTKGKGTIRPRIGYRAAGGRDLQVLQDGQAARRPKRRRSRFSPSWKPPTRANAQGGKPVAIADVLAKARQAAAEKSK